MRRTLYSKARPGVAASSDASKLCMLGFCLQSHHDELFISTCRVQALTTGVPCRQMHEPCISSLLAVVPSAKEPESPEYERGRQSPQGKLYKCTSTFLCTSRSAITCRYSKCTVSKLIGCRYGRRARRYGAVFTGMQTVRILSSFNLVHRRHPSFRV